MPLEFVNSITAMGEGKMEYRDILYGEWELPEFLARICQTKEMERLRGITQGVLPYGLDPMGTMPSRFEHGLGVARLAMIVLESNKHLAEDYAILLTAAALLHDAGNPPFAHLTEHFLEDATEYDGETFLAEILCGSRTEQILREYGVAVESVVRLVAGEDSPVSEVLNGSMDIDNLDNIARYAHYTGLCLNPYDATMISAAFRLGENGWHLPLYLRDFVRRWQNARRAVYGMIYSEAHLRAAMMLYRAVELAYCGGALDRNFFKLDDASALNHLANGRSADGSELLVRRAKRWQWHDVVVSFAYENEAPESTVKLASSWRGRQKIANAVAEEFKLPRWAVTAYVGCGRDYRRIETPFRDEDGSLYYDSDGDGKIYRVMVFCAPDFITRRESIREFVSSFIGA